MWDHFKTRFGKDCDGGCEESVRFGNFESNDEAFYGTDAQNLTFQLGDYVFVDLPSGNVAATCTRVILRTCGVDSVGTHSCDCEPSAASVDDTG